MKTFGILVHCYEFGSSLAVLQARCEMRRKKMARNTTIIVLNIPLLLLIVEWKSVDV